MESKILALLSVAITVQQLMCATAFAGNEGVGGGNEVGLEVQSSALAAIRDMQNSKNADFAALDLKGLSDFAKNVKFVENRNTLFAEIDGKKQEAVALNIPERNLIEINRWRWMSIPDSAAKKALALHEILSLQRLESTGSYPYSSSYLAAVTATQQRFVPEFPGNPDEIISIHVVRVVTAREVTQAKVVCTVPEGSGADDPRLAQSIGGQIYSGAFGGVLPTYWTARYDYDSIQDAMTMQVDTDLTNGHWYSSVRRGATLQFTWERNPEGMFSVTLIPQTGKGATLRPASRIPRLEYDMVSVPATQFDSWGNPLGKPDDIATNLRLIQTAGQPNSILLINVASGRPVMNRMSIDVKKYTDCLIGVLKPGS